MLPILDVKTKNMEIVETNKPKNWIITISTKDYFTCDDVIDAYIKGKNDGLEKIEKLALNKLVENVNNTSEIVNDLIKYIKKEKFNPKFAFIKIVALDTIRVLIIVPEKELLSDKFLKVYEKISEIEIKKTKEFYKIEISITDTENINFDSIESDGFILKLKI